MKQNRIRNSISQLLCILFIVFTNSLLQAQTKQQKARLSVSYYKEGNLNLLKASAIYKDETQFKPAQGLNLNAYQVFENDSLVLLGTMMVNAEGTAQIDVSKVFENDLLQYDFEVEHVGSEKYKKVSGDLSLKVAHLASELKPVDENYFIEAKLTDANNEPIPDTELKVKLQRFFSPLTVGTELYFTDENGTINVPITTIMPGMEGKLNYEVILQDSDDYGTIKSVIQTTIGKPIKDLSTFDQRTMWSPPRKAPWVVLIVPNILIFAVWLTLIILVINLFRISKHKNKSYEKH